MQGIPKGKVSLYCWPPVWLFGSACITTDNLCFYLQNRLIQTSQTGGQRYSDTSSFSIPWFMFHGFWKSISGLYYEHIAIVKDDSRVISKWCSKLWRHFLMTLEVSFTLLESSILLLENINSTGITHDVCHLRSSYFYSTGHNWLLCLLEGEGNNQPGSPNWEGRLLSTDDLLCWKKKNVVLVWKRADLN